MTRLANRLLASALALACSAPPVSAGVPFLPERAAAEGASLVPSRQIQLPNQAVPHWKEIWDEARRLARMGDYPGAVEAYRLLLGEREELAAARWEMVKVLLQLRRWEEAAESLERLREREPERLEYLQGLALLARERGQYARAVELFRKIHEQQPDNLGALAGIADALLALGQKEQALPLLEKLLAQQGDEGRRQQLAELYLELGEPAKARPLLLAGEKQGQARQPVPHPAAVEVAPRAKAPRLAAASPPSPPPSPPPAPALPDWVGLERSARWAEQEGQWSEAVTLYRRLREGKPDDPAVLAALARGYGALGREAELLAVLEEQRQLEPSNRPLLLQLARLQLDRGDLAASGGYLAALAEDGLRSPEFLALRGRYLEASRQPLAALSDYLELLAFAPEWDGVRRRVVELAGELGRVDLLPAEVETAGPGEWRLLLANSWRACRADEAAATQYRQLQADPEQRLAALLGLAALEEEAGRPYEAEEELRLALALGERSGELFLQLFNLALGGRRLAEAEAWLAGLGQVVPEAGWQLRLGRARLLAARGKTRAGVELAGLLSEGLLAEAPPDLAALGEKERGLALQGVLDFWVEQGEWPRASALATELLRREPELLAPRVVLQLVYERSGAVEKEAESGKYLLARARDPRAAWECARLYRHYRMAWPAIQFGRQFLEQVPESLSGKFLLAEGLTLAGELAEAARQWQAIARDYPGNRTARLRLAELDFARGEYGPALAGVETLLGQEPERPELLLLKERILWARQDWPAAVEAVRGYLEPPVAASLAAALAERGLAPLARPEDPRGWLEKTLLAEEEPDPLAPEFAAGRWGAGDPAPELRQEVLASGLARYRWQRKFAAELAIRRSVQRREYYLAVKLHEEFLANYPGDNSLRFDLAGVYSRLGRLGEEAALYRQLARENDAYPGLQEAVTRNGLKQRPQVALRTGYATEGGRDGYWDMEKSWQELRLTQFTQPGHSWEVTAANLDYQAMARRDGIQAKRATLAYQNRGGHGLAFTMGGGVESMAEGDDLLILQGGVEGKLGDKLTGQLSFSRDLVTDTPASVRRGIARQSTGGGLGLDLIRLLAGANYQRQDYSDGNHTNGYDLWASYLVFTEPAALKFTYTYEFKDSATGPAPGRESADGFGVDDHPYWAPKNYWSNQVGLDFKHLLSDDTLGRGVPRYYTLAYTLGSDSHGYALQSGKGGFFVELSPNFILEATVSLSSSQAERRKEAMLSLTYRW